MLFLAPQTAFRLIDLDNEYLSLLLRKRCNDPGSIPHVAALYMRSE
jgi:hypothetical protein